MQAEKYLLIGLVEDVLLVGECRTFALPVVDTATLRAVRASIEETQQKGEARVEEGQDAQEQPECTQRAWIALSISSPLELPLMVASRWGTICRVLRVDEQSIELQGIRRTRLAKAQGKQAPYEAKLQELPPTDEIAQEEHRAVAAKLAQIFGALAQGGYPEREGHAQGWVFSTWLSSLLREMMGMAGLRASLALRPLEILEELGRAIAQHKLPKDAGVQFEEIVQQWLTKPSLSEEMRRQLWSQVIAIQRRLDLYDPEVDQQDSGDEITQLEKSLSMAGLPSQARQVARRQIRLLRGMSRSHHDYSVFLQQLQLMLRLPWHPPPVQSVQLAEVKAKLDQIHTGLERPKKRILEYLAVRALGGQSRHTVLCLVGPPGTGKTSIARSIAEALHRPFVRVALGGVHDESEIRGHRLSFTAAGPGRILEAVAQAGAANAVMLLDEIDKISNDRQRSPEAALLEVLDPEQHHVFRDNFLGVPFNLSHIFFLCTANDLRAISEPLRDRLEVIELEGYLLSEKKKIVQNHLLPKLQKEIALPYLLHIKDDLLQSIIEEYTREAGVRQIQRCLESLYRHHALEHVLAQQQALPAPSLRSDDLPSLPPMLADESSPTPQDARVIEITQEQIAQVLGQPRFRIYNRRETLPIGMAQGLSVLASSGQVMTLEVGLLPGDGAIHATGRLGEVMRESAQTVWNHLKIYASRYEIAPEILCALDVHLHLPEAAQPKDGPSAGLALAAALLSALRQQPLAADLALSGECSLSGEVLPVGGVRAKILAAERAGLKRICLPLPNQIDVPKDTRLQISFVQHIHEILPHL